MATEKEGKLYQDRLKKLENLKKFGIDPFPAKGERTHTVAEAVAEFGKLSSPPPHLPPQGGGKIQNNFPPPGGEGLREGGQVVLAGRIKALRTHGGLIFGNIEDESGAMQFMLREEDLGKEKFGLFENFDLGDIFEAHGSLMETKRGEKTLLLSDYKILTKSLRALPDQYHGLKDVEIRLRKRYLDLLANPETREMFRKKSVFWNSVREFLHKKGFLEVQTPVLENVPGGADAQPFMTHHNALDRDFYLRISLELPLKRLLVGGFEKVFEIGRLFRNEGVDREHLQEYDDMEFYMAYGNEEDGMKLVEELFKKIVMDVTGGSEAVYEGEKIDWGKKWPRVDYFEIFEKETGVDLNKATADDLRKKAKELKIDFHKTDGKSRLVDVIYKRTVRKKLIHPCFLVGHPIEISPLSKTDPKNPKKVLRFQVLAVQSELGNGWAELNDPVDQRKRFDEQMKLRAAGDTEAQRLDEDFVEALEYGMPPAVGFGMSERFFAVLMDKSIRETVIFPPMRNGESGIKN